MDESDFAVEPKVGTLSVQAYQDDQWTAATVELTEKQISVKLRDWVQEDTLATYNIQYLRTITLNREESRLGVYIQGGLEHKSPIKINRILAKSPASRQKLYPLDIILKVNDISLWGKTHAQASKIIQECGDTVTFEVGKLEERDVEAPVEEKWMHIATVPIDRASLTKYKPGTCILSPCKFEVMSKDKQQRVTLKCSSEEECDEWTMAISERIQDTIQFKIEQYNNNLSMGDKKVIKMGWVGEYLPANMKTDVWCKKVMVLKESSLLLYETMPDTIEESERPQKSYNLFEMTLKVLEPHSIKNQRPNSIAIVTGTGDNHIISYESRNGIESWTADIHEATVSTVIDTKQCFYLATWQDKQVLLVLHIDKGIIILDKNNLVLWQKSFSLLSTSSDDTQNKLKITFYRDATKQSKEDLVIELDNLQLAICGLDCFMTTKVALMDPQFIKDNTDLLVSQTN